MHLKVNWCEVNKESKFLPAKGPYNSSKLPKRGQNMQNRPYCVSNAVEIWW
jgi:hypothetical protein